MLQKEVDAIHRSLSALGSVIDALTSNNGTRTSQPSFLHLASSKVWMRSPNSNSNSPSQHRRHIPYRDSKLTFVLSNCLGGNAKTHIVTTVDPRVASYESTLATLRFAQRAKQVMNRPVPTETSTYLKATSAELQQLMVDAEVHAAATASLQVV